MQDYLVRLESPISDSFRCIKVAQGVNLDTGSKSVHELRIKADLESEYNIGLIVGASGSGKTTLMKQIYGQDCFKNEIDGHRAIIDQMPSELTVDQCATILSSVGLTAIPCWVKPVNTLSNGQRARAEIALLIANGGANDIICIDEWTSVVNREVAKVMSHSIQKFVRKKKRRIVLCSCHYDVIDWLNPDWIIDCNKQTFEDRRSMVGSHKRSDQLRLNIREVSRKTWKYFSKYHYLSAKMPGGKVTCFGLFSGDDQIGFGAYANYVPAYRDMQSSNRVVIHPDYIGLGLGIKFVTITSQIMHERGFRVKATLTSPAMVKSRLGHPNWKLKSAKVDYKMHKVRMSKKEKAIIDGLERAKAFKSWLSKTNRRRVRVRTFCFDFVPTEKSS